MVKGLSAGSLIGLDLLSILRDYTLEFFYCMDLSQVINWLAINCGEEIFMSEATPVVILDFI